MAKQSITITDNRTGKSQEFLIQEGTVGTPVVNIQALYKEFRLFTFDPGFVTTASCASKITFIDGEKGILCYRGYPIEELAGKSNYLEVCYLLLYNKLPSVEEYAQFKHNIRTHSMLHESLHHFYRGFRRDAHPMAIMVGVVGALSAFYHDSLNIEDPQNRQISAYRLIAKIPTIAAYCYKFSIGQPFVYPKNKLGYVENFLNMMFSVPADDYDINPVVVDALEKIFILHADHEQNASTSTVRISGSSQANPFACISSGVTSLWGAAHGGANEAVLKMLAQIGDTKNIAQYINKAKDKNDPFRLMGFGHRVYKNYDPRAKIIKESCHKILQSLNIQDPLLEIAMRLEEIALQDEYFISRKLYPNVDFYSGIILKAIGIPTNMFTVIFTLSRTVGWISQWIEMIEDKEHFRISRPRQLYTGNTAKQYTPIEQR